MEQQTEVGKFVRWGPRVSIDMQRRLMTVLPESQEEVLVEIPSVEVPSDEALGMRCSSY